MLSFRLYDVSKKVGNQKKLRQLLLYQFYKLYTRVESQYKNFWQNLVATFCPLFTWIKGTKCSDQVLSKNFVLWFYSSKWEVTKRPSVPPKDLLYPDHLTYFFTNFLIFYPWAILTLGGLPSYLYWFYQMFQGLRFQELL